MEKISETNQLLAQQQMVQQRAWQTLLYHQEQSSEVQWLMFCAEDAVLTVLSGLNPALTNDQIREEIMMCFSLAPTRRQALEKLRAMHQETDEQMWQYIVRHEVAHLRAHKLTADEQCSISEIMEFAMKLQPYIQ